MTKPSSPTVTPFHRTSAPKVLLSTRAHIDKLDAGLTSIPGAREVITMIESRRAVTKLILGHNDLGDEGCKELFRFLRTEEGRRHKIAEISLNSNDIGDKGLEAIAEYLEDNGCLKELFLQNNAFQGDPGIVRKFAAAISTSRLELLSIVSNQQLSDRFLSVFLSELDSPTLRELQISALGLTPASTPTLISFLTSSRSRALETLKCNGNCLGLRSIRSLVRALRRSNFSLVKLEVYSNHLTQSTAAGSSATEEDEEDVGDGGSAARSKTVWEECEKELKKVLIRNEMLRRKVNDEAVALLPYARAILLSSPKHRPPCAITPERAHSPSSDTQSKRNTPSAVPGAFPFCALPAEIQHHTLSFLAPALSPAQLVRIFTYAATPMTLPPLLPKLKAGGGCIPDPASLPFGMPQTSRLCASGRCMGMGGSVLCHRNEERARWLQEVGCVRFDVDEGRQLDVLGLL